MKHGLTPDALRRIAGSPAFERGEVYAATGRVVALDEDRGRVTAQVRGTQTYHVDLRLAKGELTHSCTCPVGDDGICCKHCVAAALVWLEGRGRSRSRRPRTKHDPVTMEEVRAHLGSAPQEALVELLVDHAMTDERLRHRLLLDTARSSPRGLNLDTYRDAIDDAMHTGGFVDYHAARHYARRINEVIDSIEQLLSQDHASVVMELSEHALRKLERALGSVDDSDGYMGDLLGRLQSLHLAACERVRPNPKELARKLFAWELNSPWEVFLGAAGTYAELLGEAGLDTYGRLAEAEWSRVPPLAAGEEDPIEYSARFRITRMMETLAAQSDDVDELVTVMKRNLSMPYHYLRIAELYEQARRHDVALDWAERGIKAFPRHADSRLREFLAEAYHRLKRHDDAMNLVWRGFVDSPSFDAYKNLKRHAKRAEEWPAWRAKALAVMRDAAEGAKRNSRSPKWPWETRWDNSALVRVFLWEKDVDAAWNEAQRGGCSADLWIELARKRERDHPEDALGVFQQRLDPVVERKNNDAYGEAVDLLCEIARVMRRLGRDDAFASYLASVRARHKAKRNFVKMVDGMRF